MPEKFPVNPQPVSEKGKPEKIKTIIEKDAIDRALDIMEMAEKKVIEEGVLNLIGKGLRKSAEVLIKRPVKKAVEGVWEGLAEQFKKKPSPESEIIEMPKGSTLENEAENVIDLSRRTRNSEIRKKELEDEVLNIDKFGVTAREKEMIAFMRLLQKK